LRESFEATPLRDRGALQLVRRPLFRQRDARFPVRITIVFLDEDFEEGKA
jgi:hypothetical protein